MSTIHEKRRAKNREKILLELHRHGPFQRINLSERLGLRTNSVGSICADLLDWGIITEMEGTPANRLKLADSGPFWATVYIGVNTINIAKVYCDGKTTINGQYPYPPNRGPLDILKIVTRHIKDMCKSDFDFLCGIGLSLPGYVDSVKGIVRYAANIPGWRDINVKEYLQQHFARTILVENVVRCHLWEATWFHRKNDVDSSILYILIIEGIGCAVQSGGKLLSGNNTAAGEIGHIPCDPKGRTCLCGKQGCLEAYCSESAFVRDAVDMKIISSADEGVEKLLENLPHNARLTMLIDQAMGKLADSIAPMLGLLDPEELIIGCRNKELAQVLSTSLIYRLRDKLIGLPMRDLAIRATEASEETILRGVAGLLMQNYYKNMGELKQKKPNSPPVIVEQ